MRFSAIHHQPITTAQEAGCSRLLRLFLILQRSAARNWCILLRNQPRMCGPYRLIRKVIINPAAKTAARLITNEEDATALMRSLHSVPFVGDPTTATTGIPPGADGIWGICGMEGSCPCGVTSPLRRLICLRFVKYSEGENMDGVQKETVVQHPPVGGPRHR